MGAPDENDSMVSPTEMDVSSKRKKKFTGGNASKRHRDRVNVEFQNLAQLLPFPEDVIAKLDKSSILRLAVSYIRAKSFFKDTLSELDFEKDAPAENKSSEVIKESRRRSSESIQEGTGLLAEIFSNALEGFLLVLTEDMKVLFVSESVRDYLGCCQAGIIHENFLQFVNPTDHSVIQGNIMYRKNEIDGRREAGLDNTDFNSRHMFSNGQILHGIDGRGPTQHHVVVRRFVCRMKCAFSCSSRFYTAYRTFQFSGHLRRSNIQEGREEKHLNTLVVFATPTMEKNATVDIIPDLDEKPTNQLSSPVPRTDRPDYAYDQRYSNGFRIEPTLRPHIAPIPVTNSEATADRRSPTSVKQRQVPQLIPAAEVFAKDAFLLSQKLPSGYIPRVYSAQTMSEPRVYSVQTMGEPRIYAPQSLSEPRVYAAQTMSESRYSDYSDDSKCSPASSPNLVWKRKANSPQLMQNYKAIVRPDFTSVRLERHPYNEDERCRPNSLMESDIQHRLHSSVSPDYHHMHDLYHTRIPPSNADVYVGASMLMNLRQQNSSHYIVPDITKRNILKRSLDDRDEMYSRSPKRHSSPADPGSSTRAFHISSLLGLDEGGRERSGANTDEHVDVCRLDEDDNEGKKLFYDDIFYKMSKNIDYTFRKTMSICQ